MVFPKTATWQPLFSDAECVPFNSAVKAIAEAIATPDSADFPMHVRFGSNLEQPSSHTADLAGGRAGISLFFHYLHQSGEDYRRDEIPVRLINEALDTVLLAPPGFGLFTGLPGVAWAATHVADPAEADDDPMSEVDEVLLRTLSGEGWAGKFDLVSGLVGLGVYALERLPRPAARQILSCVIAQLSARVQRSAGAATWLTSADNPSPEQLALAPNGHHDLGVAHGISGVIGFLSVAHAAGCHEVADLLTEAVTWLLAQKPVAGTKALFPYWTTPDTFSKRTSRMGWCYGAPGMATILLAAGRTLGNRAWQDAAVDLALNAAQVAPESTRIRDAGLCHGAAGVGHLFNRLYQATGRRELGEAARFWLNRALSQQIPTARTGGFLAYFPSKGSPNDWVENAGLLTGAAGIGLAFLAATTSIEPQWDRMLLASIPLRR